MQDGSASHLRSKPPEHLTSKNGSWTGYAWLLSELMGGALRESLKSASLGNVAYVMLYHQLIRISTHICCQGEKIEMSEVHSNSGFRISCREAGGIVRVSRLGLAFSDGIPGRFEVETDAMDHPETESPVNIQSSDHG